MKKWILICLAVLFAVIFIVSTWYLIDYFSTSSKNETLYKNLAQIAEDARQDISKTPTKDEDGSDAEYKPIYTQVIDSKTGEPISILQEYARIYNMNNDLVGWIRVDGTRIDYPVLQTPDQKDYYLKRDFEGKQSKYGAIYVQENCNVFLPADNIVIYGHRMNDGSMFADLHKYKDQAFCKTHPYIQFDTLQQRQTYQIISVFLISSVENNPFQYQAFVTAESELEFDEFILNCQKYQLYDTGVSAEYGDKLITLSTCEYSNINGRLVVVAKQIADE